MSAFTFKRTARTSGRARIFDVFVGDRYIGRVHKAGEKRWRTRHTKDTFTTRNEAAEALRELYG